MLDNNISTNTNVAKGVANSNNYVGVNVLEFFKQNGITIGDDGRLQVTNPTPNNNLFSNTKEARQWNNEQRANQREDTQWTLDRGRENLIFTNNLSNQNKTFDDNLTYNRSVKDDKLGRDRANFDFGLEKNKTIFLNQQEAEKTRQTDLATQYSDMWTANLQTNQDTLERFRNSNADYNEQLHLARTRQLELDRTRIDNKNERNKQADLMEQLNALYRNNLDVARMNSNSNRDLAILEGQQRQAELDKQGEIQMNLANAERQQRGYDNQYAMLNEYTNRPRSNFAYWG